MSSQISYEVDPTFGCHLWTGKRAQDGYPVIWRGKRPSSAHRIAYELELGPIADGMVLDHLCRRRDCINHVHLEPVTQSENEKRKSWRYRSKRKSCKNGHDLRVTGVVTPEGGKVCRQCNRAQQEGTRT